MSVGEFSSSVGRIGEVKSVRSYSSSASESWYVGGMVMVGGGVVGSHAIPRTLPFCCPTLAPAVTSKV